MPARTAAERETIISPQPSQQARPSTAATNGLADSADGMRPDATGVFLLPTPIEPATNTGFPRGAIPPAAPPPQAPPPLSVSSSTVTPLPVSPVPVAPVPQGAIATAPTPVSTPAGAPSTPFKPGVARNKPAPPLPAWLKFGAAAVLLLAVVAGAWLALRPKAPKVVATSAPSDITFQVHTIPPDASVLAGTRVLGSSNSELHLPAGQHQLTARKDGYQPLTFNVDLNPDSSAPYNVTLKPLDANFHLFTPFKKGDLFGTASLRKSWPTTASLRSARWPPGNTYLRIQSGSTRATISFEDQPLALPVLARPEASGIDAVAVATFRDQAVLTSSITDLPVLVDNQPAGKLTAGAITLKDLAAGPHTLMIGEWSGNIDAGSAPSLSVFLGSLASQGKLFVNVQGSPNAHVFINGADRGVAKKGRYLVTLDPGDYEVGVSDQGFITPKNQKIQLRKGADSKLTFFLVAQPVATPVPIVVTPPPKVTGSVTVGVSPANAEVRYARSGDANPQGFRGPTMSLDPGTYIFTAHAPGYVDRRGTVEVTAGGSQTLNLVLTLAKVVPVAPAQIVHTMRLEDWEKPWGMDGVWYTRQGGDFVLYRVTPTAGVFRFAIAPKSSKGLFGGNPKMRWVMNYSDPKNYIEFQIDKQSYASEEYRNGKKIEHVKRRPHGLTEATSFEVQMTVAPTKISIEIREGDNFTTLDEWSNPDSNYTDGRFGFHLPNQDQIYLTNFSFTQKTGAK